MSWLELTLTLHVRDQDRIEAALEGLGALSITLRDADAETPDERAIFEPGVGETPLWSMIVMDALFEATTDRSDVLQVLINRVPELEPAQIAFRDVADQDWTRVWMDQFKPMQFGRRLWIYPWNIEPPDDAGTVIVRLDPGLAFGTGTHPTTALCLAWLDGLELHDKHVVDFGCGSGILALAALKLGAASVIGIDNDPQAITATINNAERNGVANRLEVFLPDQFDRNAMLASADALVANILSGPLGELAPQLAAFVKPGGKLALSGILREQADDLVVRYAEWFDDLLVMTQDDWVRISATRKR
ncbi:MAG: 50S ribosomal protein L11 methyltransferase [Dokdonella sp.]